MFRLAVSNLVQNKTRLLISVGGVGLALTLVLFFRAVFDGAEGRLTVYIDRAGADVWVSQEGVRTMHMSESALPASVVEEVRAVPGVEQAVPILYTEGMIQANGEDYIVYVFGVPPDAPLGGPSRISDGVIDDGLAGRGRRGVIRYARRTAQRSVGCNAKHVHDEVLAVRLDHALGVENRDRLFNTRHRPDLLRGRSR